MAKGLKLFYKVANFHQIWSHCDEDKLSVAEKNFFKVQKFAHKMAFKLTLERSK